MTNQNKTQNKGKILPTNEQMIKLIKKVIPTANDKTVMIEITDIHFSGCGYIHARIEINGFVLVYHDEMRECGIQYLYASDKEKLTGLIVISPKEVNNFMSKLE